MSIGLVPERYVVVHFPRFSFRFLGSFSRREKATEATTGARRKLYIVHQKIMGSRKTLGKKLAPKLYHWDLQGIIEAKVTPAARGSQSQEHLEKTAVASNVVVRKRLQGASHRESAKKSLPSFAQ